MPAIMDKIIPTWLNHAIHTIIALLIIVELLAEKHRVPSAKQAILTLGVVLGAYLFM